MPSAARPQVKHPPSPYRGIMALSENYCSSRFCTSYHIYRSPESRRVVDCPFSCGSLFCPISLVGLAGIKGAYGLVCSLLGV